MSKRARERGINSHSPDPKKIEQGQTHHLLVDLSNPQSTREALFGGFSPSAGSLGFGKRGDQMLRPRSILGDSYWLVPTTAKGSGVEVL